MSTPSVMPEESVRHKTQSTSVRTAVSLKGTLKIRSPITIYIQKSFYTHQSKASVSDLTPYIYFSFSYSIMLRPFVGT